MVSRYVVRTGLQITLQASQVINLDRGLEMDYYFESSFWFRGIMVIMTDCLSVDRGAIPREIANYIPTLCNG